MVPIGGDWGKIIDEAEARQFVGRKENLETFQQEISLPKPRYLIFYITGQGGAGKTTLLNRYQKIAEGLEFLIAECDEKQQDVPAVLGRFAQQLAEQGFSLKHFEERYKTYLQKKHEIESDPEAPQGLAAILGRTVVRSAFVVGDIVPGLRKGLDILPQELLEKQAGELGTYLAKKFSNKEDVVALMRDPLYVLTPLFFEDLNEVAQTRGVLLCIDNFEVAQSELREWLLRLREYKPSLNIRIAIAGRDQPGAKWDPLRSVTQTIRIDVFTEQEAESFLNIYSITDPKRLKEILELSGRLPVLMSWLAAVGGNDIETSIPTHDIVERFLRWVIEPELRQVALLTAIPRSFNADLLKLLLENRGKVVDEQSAFDWLQTMPFVKQGTEGWRYHDVVRRMMLHYQRQKNPQTYRQIHTVLANFYNTYCRELRSSEEEQWLNEEWRKSTLAYAYHFLVADSNKHWGEVMSLFIVAIQKYGPFALEMIEMLNSDDIHDELSSEQNGMIQLFRQQLQALEEGKFQDGFEMFDRLCDISNLSSEAKGYALVYRGAYHQVEGKNEKALSDFEEALHYISDDIFAILGRGETYRLMERYQEALADFDRVIALNVNNSWAIGSRGEAYLLIGRYPEALTDFEQAISLNEKSDWYRYCRAVIYMITNQTSEFEIDIQAAIELAEATLNTPDNWRVAFNLALYKLVRGN